MSYRPKNNVEPTLEIFAGLLLVAEVARCKKPLLIVAQLAFYSLLNLLVIHCRNSENHFRENLENLFFISK